MKVNFDVATSTIEIVSTAIARDHSGSIVFAAIEWKLPSTSIIGKVFATILAIIEALKHNLRYRLIEGNCKCIISYLASSFDCN